MFALRKKLLADVKRLMGDAPYNLTRDLLALEKDGEIVMDDNMANFVYDHIASKPYAVVHTVLKAMEYEFDMQNRQVKQPAEQEPVSDKAKPDPEVKKS